MAKVAFELCLTFSQWFFSCAKGFFVVKTNNNRLNDFYSWIQNYFFDAGVTITALPGDASFRHYYRVQLSGESFIAVESLPEEEKQYPFVQLAQCFWDHGLHVPKVFAHDLAKGYVLQEDLGDDLLLHLCATRDPAPLYQLALSKLAILQDCTSPANYQFAYFDEQAYYYELNNFTYWFIEKLLQQTLTQTEKKQLQQFYADLIKQAMMQPQVCVHRDYHSRNLLVVGEQDLGIIDFQDALLGPITYDVVSLLRDCYIAWPDEQVQTWLQAFYHTIKDKAVMQDISWHQFQTWFDWMGMQRHMKAIFIFSRKWLRDADPGYLMDIPRGLTYLQRVMAKYPECTSLAVWMDEKVMQFETLLDNELRSVV